jgi:hypothetical protein
MIFLQSSSGGVTWFDFWRAFPMIGGGLKARQREAVHEDF